MTYCPNHPTKIAKARGLCMACYQKQRRNGIKAQMKKMLPRSVHDRPKNGSGVIAVVSFVAPHMIWDVLNEKIERPDPTPDDPDPCHLWTGTKTKGGHGVISRFAQHMLAHRLVRALTGGDPHAEVVMHKCDNPGCVNPNHLKDGTYMENTQDMSLKGRAAAPFSAHLRDRARHPCARPVMSPLGIFPSATLAAEANGIHPRMAALKAEKGAMTLGSKCFDPEWGWYYLPEEEIEQWEAAGRPVGLHSN